MNLHPDALTDLRNSGLTDGTIERCAIGTVRPERLKKLGAKYTSVSHATEFMYFNIDGAPRKYSRLKLFWNADTGNGDGKRPRYFQSPGTGCALYLPPLVDWQVIAQDPGQTLVLTEGEKKSAAGCQAGMACAAVSGVWNWRNRVGREDRIALQDFDLFAWRGRTVELVPDSDAWDDGKEFDILAGLYELGLELKERGARCLFVRLPGVAR